MSKTKNLEKKLPTGELSAQRTTPVAKINVQPKTVVKPNTVSHLNTTSKAEKKKTGSAKKAKIVLEKKTVQKKSSSKKKSDGTDLKKPTKTRSTKSKIPPVAALVEKNDASKDEQKLELKERVELKGGETKSPAAKDDQRNTFAKKNPILLILLGILIGGLTVVVFNWTGQKQQSVKVQSAKATVEKAVPATVDPFEKLRQSCEAKNAMDCFRLGALYSEIKDVENSLTLANKYFIKSCELDNGTACFNAGVYHQFGHGVEKSSAKAAKYYLKSCNLNEAKGCTNIGSFYLTGDGIEKSDKKAIEAYEKSCQLGDTKGCTNLASLYQHGIGVKKSEESAQTFFKKACELGDTKACSSVQ